MLKPDCLKSGGSDTARMREREREKSKKKKKKKKKEGEGEKKKDKKERNVTMYVLNTGTIRGYYMLQRLSESPPSTRMVSCAKQRGPRGDHTDSRVCSNMSICIYILKISYSFIIIRNMSTVARIHMYYVYECTCVKQRTMPVGIITGTNTVRVPGPPVVARLPCKRRMISGIGAGESFARSIRTVLYVLYYYNTYATHPGTNAIL